MTVIGYARVSTVDQNPEAQDAALRDAGCVRVFTDHASGSKADRPQLTAALNYLNAGDTLVVWRLDRLGRSLPHRVDVVRELSDRHNEFRSLTEAIDTSTPSGRLLFHVAAAFAEFERDLIQERTRAGMAAARYTTLRGTTRARGRQGWRPAHGDDARPAHRGTYAHRDCQDPCGGGIRCGGLALVASTRPAPTPELAKGWWSTSTNVTNWAT